jgi:Group II intron, maturase-specific domain
MAAIRGMVKGTTAPRSRLKEPIGILVAELNPVLRGWGNHWRWGNSADGSARHILNGPGPDRVSQFLLLRLM